MTSLISSKSIIANTLKDTNKKKSHSKLVTSKNILENSDFKSFLNLYLNNETEFFERIDGYDGFISTQQLESIDYENFSEHVFFDSAVEKVNYAFDKAINDFPYDKTQYQLSQYLKKLDGFSKFVLDNKVKKSINYLSFNENLGITIKDSKGSLLGDYKGYDHLNNFNPKQKSFSFDFWIYPENVTANNLSPRVCVFQKYSNNQGFFITLKNHNTTNNTCIITFFIVEGQNFVEYEYLIKTQQFQHIFFEIANTINNNDEVSKTINFFVDGKKISNKSSNVTIIGDVTSLQMNLDNQNFVNADVFIGCSKDQNYNINNQTISFSGFFKGILDEFRFFIGKKRNQEEIIKYKNENINAQSSLVLYLRFNEPDGIYTNNDIVLDFSGNKLHGQIKNATLNLNGASTFTDMTSNYDRNSNVDHSLIPTPLLYENIKINPVLFSSHSHDKKNEMIQNAADYDLINPNSFWKLFPKNIFLEGSDFDNINETYISQNTKSPKSILGTEKSVNQEIIKLISIWARFFDQIKMYIDSFTEILNFNYDTLNKNKKIDGMILPLALNQLGFKFKELYAFPLKEKLDGKNLSYKEIMSTLSIRQIQNILWKRFLLNSKDYIMSKGNFRSIKSAFNSFGLEADKFISIKEINGQNKLNIDNQFYSNRQRIKFIDFNKHAEIFNATIFSGNETYPENKIVFCSENVEKGTLNFENDWSLEFILNFDKSKLSMFNNKQSLFRINRLINNNTDFDNPYVNVIFTRTNKNIDSGEIILYLNFNGTILTSTIENINLFNGKNYLACLRKKYNKISQCYEYVLNIEVIGHLSYTSNNTTSIITKLKYVDDNNTINKYNITIGEYKYLDQTNNSTINDLSYETCFQGKISHFRLYDVYLIDDILRIKTKDVLFLGSNKNNISNENLKINADLSKEIDLEYTGNNIDIFNFTTVSPKISTELKIGNKLLINNKIQSNLLFSIDDVILLKQNYEIDIIRNSNKIHINSFENESFKDQYKNYNISFTSQLHPDYLYYNDTRLYIDFSAVNFLNQDISKLIAINDYFTDRLSLSSYLYECEYIDFRLLRDKYFNRLKVREEINFNMLYQVYKYFDNILEDLLYESIPSRVNYLGFNFVYESHILERNKYQYRNYDSRLPLSSNETLTFQNYKKQDTKFRIDDTIGFKEKSIVKKI